MATRTKAMQSVDMLNAIRSSASRTYQETIPVATLDNIYNLKSILFDDNYQVQLNEFINSLVNRIGLTIVRNKSFNNPLARFKKGSVPLGLDIQDIYTNPATSKEYVFSNTAMAELLTIENPDTKAAYYRRNRRSKFKVTITRENLMAAFVSLESFNDFVTSLTQSLYSGNYIEEFNLTKALIDGAYDNDKMIQTVVTDVTDKDTAEDFVAKARELYMNFSFPSNEYNSYEKMNPDHEGKPVTTWTESERVVLIIRSDIYSKISVKSLAAAFNMSEGDFLGSVIVVDKFENDKLKAIICDEAFLQIYDNLLRADEFYNPEVMAWNYYVHAWSTFALCPFANAIALVTEESVPVETISFEAETITIEGVGETEGLDMTIDPVDATSNINYVIGDPQIATVKKDSDLHVTVTAVSTGETTLTAVSDNGKIATTIIKVTETV